MPKHFCETCKKFTHIQRILNAADSLDHMPERYRVYGTGMEYVILYQPDESRQLVKIFRVIYGGRDIRAQLEQNELQQEPD